MRKKHSLAHEQAQKKAPFWARFGARRNAEKSTIWSTTKRRKKHDFAHDETQKKARFGARRNAEKSTIWSTTKRRKKHDLEHDETQKKARFGAWRNAEKSTIWSTTKRRKKHDLEHDETQKKARFGARRNAEKRTIWSTMKRRKEHDLEHDQTQKNARFGARRRPYRPLPLTKPEPHHDDVCDEWCRMMAVITSFVGSDNSWTIIVFFLSWFWKVLEDARCETTRNCYICAGWTGLVQEKKRDFMVHHLGAGFSKETFYWLLQHKGRSQTIHNTLHPKSDAKPLKLLNLPPLFHSLPALASKRAWWSNVAFLSGFSWQLERWVSLYGNLESWLVVGPPLWKIWKSIGMIIPNIWENRKCSKPPTR